MMHSHVPKLAFLAVALTSQMEGISPACARGPTLAPVYLGGLTSDMTNLSQANATASYRNYGGGLYVHADYVLANTSGRCPQQKASVTFAATIATFANTPAQIAEVGMSTPLGLSQLINCNYQGVGLRPAIALVNIKVGVTNFNAWQPFADAGKIAGLAALGPIASPNSPTEPQDWNNSYWDSAKQMARYGGALGMDTPPLLYTARGPLYVKFAQQQLAWCAATGVACIDIVSPANGEAGFEQDALNWVKKVVASGVFPASWVIENYNVNSKPSIGTETQNGSLARTALTALLALRGQ